MSKNPCRASVHRSAAPGPHPLPRLLNDRRGGNVRHWRSGAAKRPQNTHIGYPSPNKDVGGGVDGLRHCCATVNTYFAELSSTHSNGNATSSLRAPSGVVFAGRDEAISWRVITREIAAALRNDCHGPGACRRGGGIGNSQPWHRPPGQVRRVQGSRSARKIAWPRKR